MQLEKMRYEEQMLLHLIKQFDGIGKTAVMKVMFMLQSVKNCDLDYDFSIYTYGPYSADVTEDLDTLIFNDLVISTFSETEGTSYSGYAFSLKDGTKLPEISEKDIDSLKDIIKFSQEKKTAKNLELYSTTIYMYNHYKRNKRENNELDILKNVNEIKPHFSIDQISKAFNELKERRYI
ncbi:MAG: hypothetical protein FWE02_06385 [Defluviitaleaceae bacterium]|nr:hypothetical protein [Defluviitaleaceae bacterium]